MEAIFRFMFAKNPTEEDKKKFSHRIVSVELFSRSRITPSMNDHITNLSKVELLKAAKSDPE
jgi:hypothetical protein